MEVRPGYKQTEVGLIPNDWETLTIAGAARKIIDYRGRTPRKLGMDWGDGDIPALSARNVKMGYIDLAEECYFGSQALYKRWMANGHIEKDDIVITTEAPLGNVALIPDGRKYILSQRTVLLQVNREQAFNSFLFQVLLSQAFQRVLSEHATGSTAQGIQRKKFEKLSVVRPPLPEQRAIAAALSDVDELLAKLDQLIAKKRDVKQAAMQQLLTGQSCLPGFRGEWEVKRLGEIADCLDNLRVPLNEVHRSLMKGDYPYCGANGVLDFVNDYVIDDDIILMAEDGGYFDEYATRPIAYRMVGKCWVNNHAHILKAKPDFDQRFIFYSLVHKNILSYLASGTRAKLNKSEMNKIEVRLPMAKDEQGAIATVLSDVDAEITVLEARRDKTRALKQGMMQELLTGRIRLVQPETKPEDAMPAHDQLRKAANDGRNWAFNEAVIISVLVENFADASHPLGRMRYTKLSYLLHRYANEDTEGYLKKAAGPYNPATRYKGPERIAQTSGYVKAAKAGNLHGFVADEQAYKARTYFDKWYGSMALEWLGQFRYEKNEALELLTTVDKVVEELRSAGKEVTVQSVKEVLLGEPEWKPKLERPVFSDEHIQAAILRCQRLFGAG